MRIAQIAPLYEAVPPKLYGGTERVVSFLTEELVALGHNVTLFASGDSVTAAELESVIPRALRLDPSIRDLLAPQMLLMEAVRRRADEFDILHFHLDYLPFSLFSRQQTPFVTTLHGRLDLPELKPIFKAFRDVSVVSISDSQREPLPERATLGPSTMVCPRGCCYRNSGRSRTISPSSAVSRRKKGPTAPSASRGPAVSRSRSRRRWTGRISPGSTLSFARCWQDGGVEMVGEISDAAEGGLPVQCGCAADADCLAGTVRPGDDRGDGLRHAGYRLQPRFGARDH